MVFLLSLSGMFSPPLGPVPSAGVFLRSSTSSAVLLTGTGSPATLYSGVQYAVTPAGFWGVVAQTATTPGIAKDQALGSFLNSTPVTTFTFTQMSDQCNITANRLYSDSGSWSTGCGFSLSAAKAWCSSRGTRCLSVVILPGENNNSAEDGGIANYLVHTLHFQPTYFAIGNEPQLWKHYGKPWGLWRTTDASTPTPLAYAIDVRNGIKAVRSTDPSAQFIGIESMDQQASTWFQAVARVDGSQIAAVAYHTYPSMQGKTTVTLSEFLAPLVGAHNLTSSYAMVRSDLQGMCSSCGKLPIFISEFDSGPGWAPSNYAGTWANAVFLAAMGIQALRANVSSYEMFHLQSDSSSVAWSMMNSKNALSPSGALYSKLLCHLQLGHVMGTKIVTQVGSVWSVLTVENGQASLLVVNADTSQGIDLGLNHVLNVKIGTTPTIYSWSSGATAPAVHTAALSTTYTVPALGMLLIDFTV